ncbi:MAG: hypothetical protein NUW01_17550 [Gemmatimonadaceae bacterium]|nr:hypothetical protein [Gemmatimonadaceae bacterium]
MALMKRVAIIGHGYVGKAVEAVFAGRFEISTYDVKMYGSKREACMGADLAFVCVPTPQGADGAADISAVKESVAWLDAPLIVVKSTIPPGTADYLSKRHDKAVHYSPEYIVERNPVETPRGWVIVGGPRASEVLDFYQAVMPSATRLIACRAVEAELTKYMTNAYLATKVTFCNEFAGIARAFGVDYKALRELWLNDPRIEADHTVVFSDAPGFDGKCLPKDLAAIIAASVANGFVPDLLKSVQTINDLSRGG